MKTALQGSKRSLWLRFLCLRVSEPEQSQPKAAFSGPRMQLLVMIFVFRIRSHSNGDQEMALQSPRPIFLVHERSFWLRLFILELRAISIVTKNGVQGAKCSFWSRFLCIKLGAKRMVTTAFQGPKRSFWLRSCPELGTGMCCCGPLSGYVFEV